MSYSEFGSLSRINTEASLTYHRSVFESPPSGETVAIHQPSTGHRHHTQLDAPPLLPVPGTREDADKVLAGKYISRLKSAHWIDDHYYKRTKLEEVPSNSTFGLWWEHYRDALTNPNFVQWGKEVGLNVATLRLSPHTGDLAAEFNGEKKKISLLDDVGWADVAEPILSAAKVLAPPRRGDPVYLGGPDAGVSLEVVGNFYGEDNHHLTSGAAQTRAAQLQRSGVFPSVPTHDVHRSQVIRGPQALAAQQQILAEIDDHHSVLTGQPDTSAQAKADRLLASRYAAELRKGPWDGDGLYERHMSEIPEGSTFGQWWKLYREAFKTPQFNDWVKATGADPSTLTFFPPKDVSGTFHGAHLIRNVDYSEEWAQALGPVQAAAAALTGTRNRSVSSPVDFAENSAPLKLVAGFHAHNLSSFDENGAVSAAAEIERSLASFSNRDRGSRLSRDSLEAQQLAIGNLHDKSFLTQTLTEVENAVVRGSENVSSLFEQTFLRVHPHSSYGQNHSVPQGFSVSTKAFIEHSGLSVPHNREQLSNLRTVLNSPPLQAPAQANHWRFLTKPLLSSAQREQVRAVSADAIRVAGGHEGITSLFGGYDRTLGRQGQSPQETLGRLLSSDMANTLGVMLETKLQGKSTATSAVDWAAAAMVLDLDSTAGTQRNSVAGYDLAQKNNWGATPQTIVSGLAQHLVTQGNVSEQLAPAASRLLLAGMAPEFLVANLPSTLVYGSHAWFSFSVAVARIEKMAPGASQTMTFQEVMAFGQTQPISVSEHDMHVGAQRDAIVDWGIINGFITKRSDQVYSAQDIESARTGFNQQRSALALASDAQQAAIPSHKQLALAQLRAKLGDDIDFEKKSIKHDRSFNFSRWFSTLAVSRQALIDKAAARYSILELYLSGDLNRPELDWVCIDHKVPFDRVKSLPDLSRLYASKVDSYSTGLKNSVALNIRNLIAQLPLEDRKNFEFGTPELYSVRGGDAGLVVRTRRTSPPTDYELFASQKMLRKHIGLPDPIPSNSRAGQTFVLDASAYKNGVRPQEAKTSTNVYLDSVPFSGSLVADERADSDVVPRSFFTQNTKDLASAAANFFVSGFETLKEKSKATKSDEGKLIADTSVKDKLVRMIPFVAAAEDAKAGKYGAALVDLAFDVFGFLAPELKLVEAGESALVKLGSSEIESLASSGIKATAEGEVATSVKLGDGAGELSSVGHGINRQQVLSPSALQQLAQRGDVAVGSAGANAEAVAVVAQYDEVVEKWYAYDARAGKSYGPPLSDFKPEVSAAPVSTAGAEPAAVSLLERGLEQDNVIQMGGKMKDLKLIGGEIHTFTDRYKGVRRLNIVAHGTRRDWLDKLLRDGSQVMVDGQQYNAKQLVELLKSKGVDPSSFDNVRLLVCHSAEGKGHSFAARFQKEINRPVKAFEGTVAIHNNSTSITQTRSRLTNDFKIDNPGLSEITAQVLADNKLKRDFENKVTQFVEKKHGNVILMNTAGLGQPPKNVLQKIVYKPRYFV
ncbi:hypothetical protein SAMN04490179_3257 [Pseudomonas antarctica]|uniref:Peptidase C80 domain-containing protein n=1 Tax=Pseudomonas antarctica TaxID=219572 RepID=A0A1G9ZR73_9PSED|nr:hypothetical protein PSAN_38190 [Pseudomonas antarctica]SDN23597.1 hypothetical protein SAMN04490179_3257 [Pseudomonas antarctica]